MRLSELIDHAEMAIEKWGDLECCMDTNDDEISEVVEVVCEIDIDKSKRILITNYRLSEPHLSLVR